MKETIYAVAKPQNKTAACDGKERFPRALIFGRRRITKGSLIGQPRELRYVI